MRLSQNPVKPDPAALALPECGVCAGNAGVNAGMAGATPCVILERFLSSGRQPEQWETAQDGCRRCAAFEDDFADEEWPQG